MEYGINDQMVSDNKFDISKEASLSVFECTTRERHHPCQAPMNHIVVVV